MLRLHNHVGYGLQHLVRCGDDFGVRAVRLLSLNHRGELVDNVRVR